MADLFDCPRCNRELEETVVHAFYHCEQVRPFWSHVGDWTAQIDPKQLVLVEVGYVVDNVDLSWKVGKYVAFLVIIEGIDWQRKLF